MQADRISNVISTFTDNKPIPIRPCSGGPGETQDLRKYDGICIAESPLPSGASVAVKSIAGTNNSGECRNMRQHGPQLGAHSICKYREECLRRSQNHAFASPFFLGFSDWSRIQDSSGHVQHLAPNLMERTHLMASSNTLFRFLCVNAEHSRYL